MKIKHEYPPIWDKVTGAGMRPDPKNVIFTYGDTIYVPGGFDVADHLVHHEETHCLQQGDKPEQWWARYIADPYFRIAQEAEAYGRQYAYICQRVKDRNQRHRILGDLARMLSGPTYGGIIDYRSAYDMIRAKSGVSKP